MDELVRLLQLAVNGTAAGCIYGLVALGFVLIYKATEMVNFAQGELMMLGAFFAYTFVGLWGLNYWLGFGLAIAATAAFGYALDAVVLRRVIGQPQFAVVMLTLGLAFIFRAVAGATWESLAIESLIAAAPDGTDAHFYRSSAGAEIDLLLTLPGRAQPWAIEIKRSLAPKLERGFHHACETVLPERKFVVYGGRERYPFAPDIEAITLTALCNEVARAG